MKNTLGLLFLFCQVVAYAHWDSLIPQWLSHHIRPDYSKTIFPKDDGLTYHQFVGETDAGYCLANAWRRDTLNGGFNKKFMITLMMNQMVNLFKERELRV